MFVVARLIKHFYIKLIYNEYLLTDYEICLLVAILLSLWPFAPHGNLFNNWLNIIYFLPVGLLLSDNYKLIK